MRTKRFRCYIGVSLERFLEDVESVKGLPGGFTAYPAAGWWLGEREDTTVVEIIAPKIPPSLCGELATVFEQREVLLTVEDIKATFIRPEGGQYVYLVS